MRVVNRWASASVWSMTAFKFSETASNALLYRTLAAGFVVSGPAGSRRFEPSDLYRGIHLLGSDRMTSGRPNWDLNSWPHLINAVCHASYRLRSGIHRSTGRAGRFAR